MTWTAPGKEMQAREPEGDFPRLLEQSKAEIAKVLPEGVSVDRVCRMALTAFKMNPDLRDCTPISILSSVMKAAELGLEPHGGLKQCWLIPYYNKEKKVRECTFQLGYQGALELARRSGQFRAIRAVLVYENDVFRYVRNPRPSIEHVPALRDPGAEIGCYVYGILTSLELEVEWMPRAEIEKVRQKSKSGNVWNDWWGEQAKKTALKRFLKVMPQSVQLATALQYDHEGERMEAIGAALPAPAPAAPAGSRSAALGQRLKAIEAYPDADDYGGEVPGETIAEEPRRQREPGEEG